MSLSCRPVSAVSRMRQRQVVPRGPKRALYAGLPRSAGLARRPSGAARASVLRQELDAGLAAVHGVVMSEGALAQLTGAGIAASYGSLVPRILNKPQTDLCPLEKLTQGIETPAEAVAALQAFTRR